MVPDPRDVLERRRQVVVDRDPDGFADLFAVDGVIEVPFADPAMPGRIVGREAIRAFSRHAMSGPLRVDDLVVTELYQTADPQVVIVELVSRVTDATSGRSFAQACIQVFRIREGRITLFRDYVNPAGLTGALGA